MTSYRIHLPERVQPSLVRRGQVPLRAANARALVLRLEGALADAAEMSQPTKGLLWREHLPQWKQLRSDVARADDESYALLRAWADAKQNASVEVRALIAFAFDAEPYADALLREARGHGDKSVFALLLSNAREVEMVAEVGAWLARFRPEVVVERGEDVLERFAGDALALERIFLAWSKAVEASSMEHVPGCPEAWSNPPKVMRELLACVGTPAVATHITEALGTARGRQLATRYFERFPERAEAALGPLARKRSRAGEVAKALLGVLPGGDARTPAAASLEGVANGARLKSHSILGGSSRLDWTTDCSPIMGAPFAPSTTCDGPDILADPPWRRWKKAGFLVLEDLPMPTFALPPEAAARHDRHAWVAKLPSVPLGAVTSSGAALMVTQLWFTRRDERAAAEEWLRTFAPIATYGLVPFVLGPPGTSRTIATAGLRFLWKAVGEDRGTKIIERWCEDARQPMSLIVPAVRTILDADARWVCPASAPQAPTFLALSALPLLRMRDGVQLSETARKHLVEMMIFAGAADEETPEYVGAAEVRAALEPSSLHAFSWAVFEAWSTLGAVTKTSWPLGQLVLFGGRDAAPLLGAQVRSLATEKSVERALDATSVLARLPEDAGLLPLLGLAETTKNERVRGRAKELLQRVANERGVGLEVLCDGLVPDLEYQASADLDAARKAHSKRLERAMCEGRVWTLEAFRARLLGQPLLRSICTGILFSAETQAGARVLFRVAEDGSLADLLDAPITLQDEAQISIPHPLFVRDESRAAWGQVWADYQLTQPFPQLGREVFVLTPEERAAPVLTRLIGLRGETALFFALEQRGWTILGHRTETYGAERMHLRFTTTETVNLVRPKETPRFAVAHAAFTQPPTELQASEALRDLASLASG